MKKISETFDKKTRILTCSVLILGLILGAAADKFLLPDRLFGGGTEKVRTYSSESNTIAVVNLDEGYRDKEKTGMYSSTILESMEDEGEIDIRVVSLETARLGVESGAFAAYIIIPADFSKNINTLNDKPIKSNIEYSLSSAVSRDAREQAILDLSYMGETLNKKISFMYVYSIMDEFHNAQDNTSRIMENDVKDWKRLNEIEWISLYDNIVIPETKEVENNIVRIDVNDEFKEYDNVVNRVTNEYSLWVDKIRGQISGIRQESDIAKKDNNAMQTPIEGYDPLKSSNGASVYEAGKNRLIAALESHNKKLVERDVKIFNALKACKEYFEGIGEDVSKKEKIEQINYMVLGKAIKLLAQETEPIEVKFTEPPAEEVPEEPDEGEQPAEEPAEGEQPEPEEPEEKESKATRAFIKTFAREIGSIDWKAMEITKEEYFSSQNIDTDKSAEERLARKIMMGNLPEKYTPATRDFSGIEDILEVDTEQENGLLQAVTSDKVNIEESVNSIDDGIITPIIERNNQLREALLNTYKIASTSMAVLASSISGFQPDSSLTEAQIAANQHVYAVRELNRLVQQKLDSQTADYEAYAATVYRTTSENVENLKQTMVEKDLDSGEKLAEGLQVAKDSRQDSSDTNVSLLRDFSIKLPYTRNGSMANTATYDFITEPTDAEGDIEYKEGQAAGAKGTGSIWTEKAGYLAAGIGLLVLLLYLVNRLMHRKNNRTF